MKVKSTVTSGGYVWNDGDYLEDLTEITDFPCQ